MKTHLFSILTLANMAVLCLIGPAGAKTDSGLTFAPAITLGGSRNGHHFIVHLSQRPFRHRAHRVTRTGKGLNDFRVDGRYTFDGDNGPPWSEPATFSVTVDGKKWVIPSRLWRDCFDLTLWPDKGIRPTAVLSPDGNRLSVRVNGGDAAGTYRVVWFLRRDGHDRRKVYTDLEQ